MSSGEPRTFGRLGGAPAGFVLIDSAGATWTSGDGVSWDARDPVPSASEGESAAGVARIGERIAVVDNLHPFTTGPAPEGWQVWVGTTGS
jgi:hypothetical protein